MAKSKNNEQIDLQIEKKKSNQKINKKVDDNISKMSYETSLEELDLVISQLQNDNIKIDDLSKYYTRGNLLLTHCQRLLDILEQEVIELDLDDFNN